MIFISTSFLKSYTGGYHAKHYYECYIYSIFTYIVLMVMNYIISDNYKPFIGIILLIISTIVIFKFAPIENENNPKTEEEMAKNKRISRIRISTLSIIGILGYVAKADLIDTWFMLAITVFSIAYSITKQKFLERGVQGGKHKDKSIKKHC